jgi:hypothetical protein
VKAGKAYISSLGTTGLLIASSLLLLAVGGTIVAFDRWPDGEGSRADVVAVDAGERAVPASTVTERRRAARARTSERRRARAAAQRRRARARAKAADGPDGRSSHSVPLADPVISDLPAPDTDGSPGQSSGGSGGPAGGGASGGGSGGRGGGGGGETTRQIGNAVSNVSPQAGAAIGEVGTSLDQALSTSAPSLAP